MRNDNIAKYRYKTYQIAQILVHFYKSELPRTIAYLANIANKPNRISDKTEK